MKTLQATRKYEGTPARKPSGTHPFETTRSLEMVLGNQTPESDETTSGFRKIFGLGIKCKQVF